MSKPSGGLVSTAFPGRLAVRTRLRRWSKARIVLLALGLVTLVVVVLWALFGSSLFAVREVQVRGVTGAAAEQVRVRAVSSIGDPMARVDSGAITKAIKEIPSIADVKVVRVWPHTLRLEVTVRPDAAVAATRTGYQVLDATGVVLRTTTKRPASLPLVVVGGGPGASLATGLTVMRSAPPAVRARVKQVTVKSAQDVRLELDKNVTVRWGSVDDAVRKAAVLSALLTRKATVYDVSAPDLPTTRL